MGMYHVQVLTLYRLHEKKCNKNYSRYDRGGTNCNCPIYIEGKLGAKFHRNAVGTRSMTRARRLVVEAEERGSWDQPKEAAGRVETQYVIDSFLASLGSSSGANLAKPTMAKYRTLMRRLGAFCEQNSLVFFEEIKYTNLENFRATWKLSPITTALFISKLRVFWKYAIKHEWTYHNLAAKLELPLNYRYMERMPFTDAEMDLILEAARIIKVGSSRQAVTNFELETLILLMRYSGMGIADAVLLQQSEIKGDEIRYYRKKTMRKANRPLVVVPIPVWLAERIHSLPLLRGKYYFCHSMDHLPVATRNWHMIFPQLFKKAGISRASPHRFRHTFCCSLLEKHVPIELVSRYLGHRSIAVTQRYYSHFLESRIQADSDVLRKLYSTVDKDS